MKKVTERHTELTVAFSYRAEFLTACLLLPIVSAVLAASCRRPAQPEPERSTEATETPVSLTPERPFSLTMEKRSWLESEVITITVTLKPPAETTCLIPAIDARMLEITVSSNKGKSYTWPPHEIIEFESALYSGLVPIERGPLKTLSFTLPLTGREGFFYLGPGGYRLSAVYCPARILDDYDFLFACAGTQFKPPRNLRQATCTFFLPLMVDKWRDCFKSAGFFQGPFESNTLEFEVLPDKSRSSPATNKPASTQ